MLFEYKLNFMNSSKTNPINTFNALNALFKPSALCVVVFSLAACGGGESDTGGGAGGGTGGTVGAYAVTCPDGALTSSHTSTSDTSNCRAALPAQLQTAAHVPTPTYPAGSEELLAFNEINRVRGECGFGLLKQDTRLDAAAQAHTLYVRSNVEYGGRMDAYGHYERSDYLNYTGYSPSDRALYHNYGAGVTEVGNSGSSSGVADVRTLLQASYHVNGVLFSGNDVGLDKQPASTWGGGGFFANPGYLTEAQRNYLASGQVAQFPCNTATVVALTHSAETPNPMQGSGRSLNSYGSPLVIASRADTKLYIDSWALSYMNGATSVSQPAAANGIRTKDNDASNTMYDHQGFFIPDQALKGNANYTSVVSGRIREVGSNGLYLYRPFTKTVTFRTPCPLGAVCLP